jgi:hypothetical protein
LMQGSVRKVTTAGRPRSSAGLSGGELSHPAAPPSEGRCKDPDMVI